MSNEVWKSLVDECRTCHCILTCMNPWCFRDYIVKLVCLFIIIHKEHRIQHAYQLVDLIPMLVLCNGGISNRQPPLPGLFLNCPFIEVFRQGFSLKRKVQRSLVYYQWVISAVMLASLHALRCPPVREVWLTSSTCYHSCSLVHVWSCFKATSLLHVYTVLIPFASITSKLVCHFVSNFSVSLCEPQNHWCMER
jgi:hypothetical protein